MMIINDELIEQWEPQVHKIARTMSIIGMDYDDIVQELRMGVIGQLDLSCMEREFIQLRMEGFSMKELGEKLGVKGVYRLNKQIKQKVKDQLGKKRETYTRL